ncbi:MAG: hypothetical protein MJ052_01085 [Sphaerochaetaceae bacterium]|nr:hypothetical protein [Sphaerochaetaceae bacterium]
MFSNPIPSSDKLLNVLFEDYAQNHFLKNFKKKYPGVQWMATECSIRADLGRLRMRNNTTQYSAQIDQLKHKGGYWLAKYDFRVAKTKESSKSSGNRCIVFIDDPHDKLSVLLIYSKTDLPKNKDETVYIYDVLDDQYKDVMSFFR